MDGDEQFRRAQERQQPQESPLHDAVREKAPDQKEVREVQPRKEGQEESDKPEVRIDQLDPAQRAVIGRMVREMKACLTMVDDGLKAMERQRQQTPDYQRASFDDWHDGYCEKMLADFRRNMDELGAPLPFRIALDVQGFGPPGKFRPETFKVTVPPRAEDLALHGCNAVVKVHSDNLERESDLKGDAGPDKFVSGWELVYWMMRRGGLTRQPDALSA